MARKGRVEVVLPNGTSVWVPEHLVKDMTHFGGVLASQRTFRNPPKELLTAPIPRKVIIPVIEPVNEVITPDAEYPKEEVEQVTQKPVDELGTIEEKPVVKTKPPIKKAVRKKTKK